MIRKLKHEIGAREVHQSKLAVVSGHDGHGGLAAVATDAEDDCGSKRRS